MMNSFFRFLNLTLWLCGSFFLLISCGSSDVDSQKQTEYSSQEPSSSIEVVDSALVDTVSGTIREVVDDGKKDTRSPCNAQIRSQIDSQQETIQELKEILEGETEESTRKDIMAEIQQSEEDLQALSTRYDCD